MTTMTSFTSDFSSCVSPTSPTTTIPGQHNELAEEQFDIINNLDYDDVDDGLIGKTLL